MPVRVLIADDSTIMRYMIKDILQQDSEIEVIASARNGRDAIFQVESHKPDVVVLDINMGEYSGLYALEHIMRRNPTPAILLSAVGNTDMSKVMKGLELGAVDYVNKPVKNNTQIREVQFDLIDKIKVAATSNLAPARNGATVTQTTPHTFDDDLPYDIVVIGSSTGGPTAVEKVLSRLPQNLALPVVIAQHMPANFVPPFVKRLNTLTPLTVVLGEEGIELEPKHVYIAPGGKNMILKVNELGRTVIGFTTEKFKEYNNPSVNALMLSAVEIYGGKAIGVILTGMGKDGTRGLCKIKEAGGYTVAQSEKTSVVFGMPKEAIMSGKVDKVVDIDEIGPFIVSSIS